MKIATAALQLAVLTTAASAAISIPAQAKPTTFIVDDPKQRDLVSFTSDAPIELIVGHTSNIKGTIDLDQSFDLSKKPLDANFEVDLTSIDTGIALRNKHMRETFLETAKFPKAVFKATSISATPNVLKDGQTVKVKASGEFTLHGKTIKREINVDVTLHKPCASQDKFPNCDLIQIKSTFPIALTDYGIQRPQVVFQKLADTVIVTISASAHHEAAAAESKKPGGK